LTLLTERLELTPIAPAETDELLALFHDEQVLRYMADGKRVERELIERWVRDSKRDFAERGVGLFAARERDAAPIVGVTGFRDFYAPPVFELIWALLPRAWGRGYAVEMARAMLEAGFTTGGLECIQASTDAPNEASIRVMERLGMQFHSRDASDPWDQVHYRLERARWREEPAQ
jgi:ribosomal-protein-alanine N-acetyltransferase